jgi:hypothetical protein
VARKGFPQTVAADQKDGRNEEKHPDSASPVGDAICAPDLACANHERTQAGKAYSR